MFRLTVIFLSGLLFSSCMPKSPKKGGTQPAGTVPTTEGFSPPNTQTGQTQASGTSTNSGTVYIFQYTGRKYGHNVDINTKSLMEGRLQRAGISPKEKPLERLKDGKAYSKEPGEETGEIHVFAIPASQLVLSERQGFCKCTLKRAEKICEPYQYNTEGGPPPSCR